MNDKELLKLAAKAAGYVVRWYEDTLTHGATFGIEVEPGNPCGFDPWNPLTDDGDALRLAAKLGLHIEQYCTIIRAYKRVPGGFWVDGCEPTGDDPCAATRRAITRAAAEIGRRT